MEPDFGTFEAVFGEGAPYLSLLHLASDDSAAIVHKVIHLARSSPRPYEEIAVLLDDKNWRPHLVGAVALAGIPFDASTFSKLWRAIDTGSWVTPQLAAVAFIRDPQFILETEKRLKNLCPLNPEKLLSMTPLERHSAAGPAGGHHRSAKMAAALIRLVELNPETKERLSPVLTAAELQKLAADDFDNSETIAEEWLSRLKELLSSL